MTASKSLPARPSLESLCKQAKKLARDIAAGDADAIARARMQVPDVDLPPSPAFMRECWLRTPFRVRPDPCFPV
jgi:hypothetical protein